MEEVKLQEAAELYADRIDDGSRTARQCAILAYKQGAYNNRASITKPYSVWHDMTELPEKGKPIYLMTGTKHNLKKYTHSDTGRYIHFYRNNNAIKWAYKNDIINF